MVSFVESKVEGDLLESEKKFKNSKIKIKKNNQKKKNTGGSAETTGAHHQLTWMEMNCDLN